MAHHFKDLLVYQKSFDAALSIHNISKGFPKEEQFALTSQIRRASKSICANIAEGFAKQKTSKNEFKRFLMISYGSANEVLVWLDFCKELGYIDEENNKFLNQQYTEICKMIWSLHDKI